MKTDLIQSLTENFEAHAQEAENGVEFWLARDLQHLLGYAEWRNFVAVVNKAKTACELSNHAISDHFVDVNKMVDLGLNNWR
jgi:DNA-damage-inducible protein D